MIDESTEDKSLALQTLEKFISKKNTNTIDLNKDLDKEVMLALIQASENSDQRKIEFREKELEAQKSVLNERTKASIVGQMSERYYVFIALGFAVLITGLIFMFKIDFVEKWITHLITLATGLLGGYGLASRKKDVRNTDKQQ